MDVKEARKSESDFSLEENKWFPSSRLKGTAIAIIWIHENILCGSCPNIELIKGICLNINLQ